MLSCVFLLPDTDNKLGFFLFVLILAAISLLSHHLVPHVQQEGMFVWSSPGASLLSWGWVHSYTNRMLIPSVIATC